MTMVVDRKTIAYICTLFFRKLFKFSGKEIIFNILIQNEKGKKRMSV